MPRYVDGHKVGPGVCAWTTLAELSSAAIAQGCTPAQFSRATEIVGRENPIKVAMYLKRLSFIPVTFEIPDA